MFLVIAPMSDKSDEVRGTVRATGGGGLSDNCQSQALSHRQ